MEMHIGRQLKKKTKNRKGGRRDSIKTVSMTKKKLNYGGMIKRMTINLEPGGGVKIANKKQEK